MKSIYAVIFVLLFMTSCREQDEAIQPSSQVGAYFNGNFGGNILNYVKNGTKDIPAAYGGRSNSFATGGVFRVGEGTTAVQVTFSYTVVPTVATKIGKSETEEYPLVVGKQKWGHFDGMPCAIGLPPVEGVYVQYYKHLGGAWLTSVADQPEDSYFEITKITPHETDPNRIWVSGKFSCLMYQMGSEGKYGGLKFKDAEFRTAILKPDYVYQHYFSK